MIRSKFKILFILFILIVPATYAQGYKGLVENFYNALGNRDFASAYKLCTGPQWGTLAQFSSTKMYGGIYHVAFSKINYKKSSDPNSAEAEVDIFVKDSVNGDGRYIQQFSLVQKGNNWLIKSISLLQTDRSEQGWNLKLINQQELSNAFIMHVIQPIYDKEGNKPLTDNTADTLERDINDPRFFQTPAGVYAVVIVENQGPHYGAMTGWCDAFVFQQDGQNWHMTDFKLNAGGGGMYGNSGRFGKLMRAGDNVVGLAITGGQMHMGDFVSTDDVIAIENGKLYTLLSITTHHDYGDYESDDATGVKICDNYIYRFIRSDKKNYDLQIIHNSCLGSGKEKEVDRVIIPFINKRYMLPAEFETEG